MTSAEANLPAIENRLRSYVIDSFLAGAGHTLQNDDDLLHVLNSLQVLRMVLDLESNFGISIGNGDLTPENLGSIEKLAVFVAGRL